jgi:peroxiredoxin (alkyl hydroperoxide reductase subunit C)
MVQVGQKAPDFKAEAVVDKQFKDVSLADYRGKWVVLFFYPLDFTFVCPTEITAFSDAIDEFKKINTQVIGASVDSKYSHLAWIETPRNKGGIGETPYPLLADITKKISSDYGVLIEEAGVALRGLFIIDPDGVLRVQIVTDLNIGRNIGEVLRLVQAAQYTAEHGEVCPANWTPGGDTIKPGVDSSKEYFAKVK